MYLYLEFNEGLELSEELECDEGLVRIRNNANKLPYSSVAISEA